MNWMATIYCVRYTLIGEDLVQEQCFSDRTEAAKLYSVLQRSKRCIFVLATEVAIATNCRVETLLKVDSQDIPNQEKSA